MAAKFLVKSASGGQFYFNLVSDEGKKLLGGEICSSKSAVFECISAVKMNAREASRYAKVVNDGKYSFTLKNASQEVIGSSDAYDDIDDRDAALSKVMHGSADAAIVEQAAVKKTKAELTKTLEARKLNRRTMRAMPGDPVMIRFGSILQQVKEDDRRLQFEYMGEAFEADIARAKAALRMIE